MSNYPDSVDNFAPVKGTDEMSEHAERHTAEESAIVATQQELDATKVLLENHTHDPQDLTHDHDSEYQPVGNYALDSHTHPPQDTTHTHDEFADKGHTHPPQDLTHNHDGEYLTSDDLPDAYDDSEVKGLIASEETARVAGDAALQDQIDTINTSGYDDSELRGLVQGNTDALADKSDTDHTHPPQDLTHNHDGEYSKDDHVHASDDSKLDKGAATYIDAKAIQDDIDGIESSISDLSDNYDQLVIDLGNAGGDLTVELEGYLKKGTASYADAAGIETEIDQEKSDRVAADAATLASSKTYTDEEIAKVFVPDVSDLATKDELTTGLAGKADEPHTHADLAAADHNHDGDYAGKTEFDAHTHDTTHDHFGLYAGKAEFDAHNHDGEYSVEGHTHDTTHDHDADYQPKGDYATKTELGAVDAKADSNTAKIDALNTSTLSLNVPVDVRAATLSTQEDANGYFASELETKLGQAPTWGQLAGRP